MLLSIRKDQVPFLGDTGRVDVTVPDLSKPLDPAQGHLLHAAFEAEPGHTLALGQRSVKLGVSAATEVNLTAYSATVPANRAVLKEFGLDNHFQGAHQDDLILVFEAGARASASAAAPVSLAPLGAAATVEAGGNVRYAYLSAMVPENAKPMLEKFFAGMRMPGDVTAPLAVGEVIAFEYGGHLKVGTTLTAGYELMGTPSVELGKLDLSEHYQFSLLGRASITAGLAGQYSIEVRGVPQPEPGGQWVGVTVRRKRAREIGVAVEANADAGATLEGLPNSSSEFLGAVLGVNAQNWLNYLAAITDRVKTFEEFDELTDTLARQYISRLTNKSFDAIKSDLEPVLEKIRGITRAYRNFDARAIALLDRFFDRSEVLLNQLDRISAAVSWQDLQGQIPQELRFVLQALTGGDLTGAMFGLGGLSPEQALANVKANAGTFAGQIRANAHSLVLEAITLAKQQFGVDALFSELERLDTPDKLKQQANEILGGFASRLIGKVLAGAKGKVFQDAFDRIRRVLQKREEFQEKLYARFREALDQNWRASLRAEWAATEENGALIQARVNLATQDGRDMLAEAARGDFTKMLADYRPEAVAIEAGSLTHRAARRTAFLVNIVGWHDRFNYTASGLDKLVTSTEQHFRTEADGSLTVNTLLELSKDKERRTGLRGEEERMYTNLVLRFAASSRAPQFDRKRRQFLIDAITSMSARYRLGFEDERTKEDELRYYLGFAETFGLGASGASFAQVAPLLPRANGEFGKVKAEYEVRFTEAGLDALFAEAIPADKVRSVMRHIVLTNYVFEGGKLDWLRNVGWAYWSQASHDSLKRLQGNFVGLSDREFAVRPAKFQPSIGLPAPEKVVVKRDHLHVLRTLINIENSFVKSLDGLQKLISGAHPDSNKPDKFEKQLRKFGKALTHFDTFDQGVNTVFAVFDQLMRQNLPAEQGRQSSLALTAVADGKEFVQVFRQPPAPGEPTPAGDAAHAGV